MQFEHTQNFAHVLEQLQVTLLVSTYQAGKLLVIGSHAGKLSFAFHGFDQVMGIAVSKDRLAIGTRRQIYFLNSAHQIAPQIEPAGSHDRCWLTRSSFVRQPANKNVPTNPLLGGTVGSRGSFLLAAMPKGDLKLSYFA